MDSTEQKNKYIAYKTHELQDHGPRYPVLLVCDHASAHIPDELNNLGVEDRHLHDHIAWDIGAAAVATELGAILQVPVVLATHSRLVVDCNRNLDDPTAFPAVSDNVPVPGNEGIDHDERTARANAFYWTYHHAVRDQIRRLESMAAAPAVIAIHSFTPSMEGFDRPWHLGALWDKDSRIAQAFLDYFDNDDAILVGDNEPYSGRHPADFTLDHHAEAEGLPHLGLEIRQDLIEEEAGAKQWAAILATAFESILSQHDLYTLRAGGE